MCFSKSGKERNARELNMQPAQAYVTPRVLQHEFWTARLSSRSRTAASGRTPPYGNVSYAAAKANGEFQRGDRKRKAGQSANPTSLPSRRLFYEVSHCLPPCPKLRLALGHVVPERHVPGSRVIHHPLQQSRGHELLGDARKRRAQAMALDLRSRLLVDPAQRLAGVDDREQGFIRFSTSAVRALAVRCDA